MIDTIEYEVSCKMRTRVNNLDVFMNHLLKSKDDWNEIEITEVSLV